ncbi:MAG: hypothetical protein ACLFTR_04445 [Candidatus Woesearchaeota archaeon]
MEHETVLIVILLSVLLLGCSSNIEMSYENGSKDGSSEDETAFENASDDGTRNAEEDVEPEIEALDRALEELEDEEFEDPGLEVFG